MHPLNVLLYAMGLGLLFNLLVGFIANFTTGVGLLPIVAVYVCLFAILGVISRRFGTKLPIDWKSGWKSTWKSTWKSAAILVPIGMYLLACALQLQTSLVSPNLVGSDIHLEYRCATMTLEQGYWDPAFLGSTINACLGITLLIPVYSLLTGMETVWVFKLLCPLIFAFLPLALYQIFRIQFGTVVAVLSVVFFVTTPMFTMDMVQLIRQQQSELFFILVVLLLLDDSLTASRKIALGTIFGAGAVVFHYGLSVGFVGYLLGGSVVVVVLAKIWRHRHEIEDVAKPMLPRLVLAVLAVVSLCMYVGYYSWVIEGRGIGAAKVPVQVVQDTVSQVSSTIAVAVSDVRDGSEEGVKPPDSADTVVPKPKFEHGAKPQPDTRPTPEPRPEPSNPPPRVYSGSSTGFFAKYPILNVYIREPLLQTAIGLDFGKVSVLGKIWRVLQYLVQLCLVIGLFSLLHKPGSKIKLEYVAFVIGSFFVLVGLFTLWTYSYGMGAVRIWHITLLFMSPLFVFGATTIGGWAARLLRIGVTSRGKLVAASTLLLLVPYCIFNLGIVFEAAKCQPVGYIDIPYSVALSGHRVDIATVFEQEDVDAVDWLKEQLVKDAYQSIVFSDSHGARLLLQRFDVTGREGYISMGYNAERYGVLGDMKSGDTGYIFLRKWNVDNNSVTSQGEYATRLVQGIGELEMVEEIIESGIVVFDNGARVILVEE